MTFEESERLDGVSAVDALDRPHARVTDVLDVEDSGHILGVTRAVHLVEARVVVVGRRSVRGESTTATSEK